MSCQDDLQAFIIDTESRHFRTGHDSGANHNALFIWNIVREFAGMEKLTRDDLIKRHADDIGCSYEEMIENYRKMDIFQFLVSRGLSQQEALRQSGIKET